jgi:hypothetical protein
MKALPVHQHPSPPTVRVRFGKPRWTVRKGGLSHGHQRARKFTEGFIKSLEFNQRPFAVRDTKVVGLLVQVNAGSKSYKVQRDLWTGERGRRRLVKTVRRTLGTTDEMTLDEARTRAEEIIALIKRGVDPNAKTPVSRAEGWTVQKMFEEYAADMRTRECGERTITDMMYRLDRYLGDWRALPIVEIKRALAREKHRDLTAMRQRLHNAKGR